MTHGSGLPIGLLAGAGRFPIAVATKVRQLGRPLVTVALRDHAAPTLAGLSDHFHWAGVAKLGRMIRLFQRHGVRDWMMAGKVQKTRVVGVPWRALRLRPDWRMARLWLRRVRDHSDDSILLGIIAEFAADGLVCRSALEICPELLVSAGVLTRRSPTLAEWKD